MRRQKNELLNLQVLGEIETSALAKKQNELQGIESDPGGRIEAVGRQGSESADFTVKAFELSRDPKNRWRAADLEVRRQILNSFCLNWHLDGVCLVHTIRKPFDMLVEGLTSKKNRGDKI